MAGVVVVQAVRVGGVDALDKPITVIVGEEVKTSQGEVIGLFLHERIERGMGMADTIAEIQQRAAWC